MQKLTNKMNPSETVQNIMRPPQKVQNPETYHSKLQKNKESRLLCKKHDHRLKKHKLGRFFFKLG